jgi:hypothetical protein
MDQGVKFDYSLSDHLSNISPLSTEISSEIQFVMLVLFQYHCPFVIGSEIDFSLPTFSPLPLDWLLADDLRSVFKLKRTQ